MYYIAEGRILYLKSRNILYVINSIYIIRGEWNTKEKNKEVLISEMVRAEQNPDLCLGPITVLTFWPICPIVMPICLILRLINFILKKNTKYRVNHCEILFAIIIRTRLILRFSRTIYIFFFQIEQLFMMKFRIASCNNLLYKLIFFHGLQSNVWSASYL